jgi:CTP synthase
LDDKIVEYLNMWTRSPDLSDWEKLVEKVKNPKKEVTIAVVGKYVNLIDSYKSLHAALVHGGVANDAKVNIRYVDSEEIEKNGIGASLDGVNGILVPGGFGNRGIEGKVLVARHAREKKIPFFGICLGMQIAVIDFARNVCGLEKANSSEFDEKTKHPVIDLMEHQRGIEMKGATMRLGSYACKLADSSLARAAYKSEEISERHRHRYEFNNEYRSKFAEMGLVQTGLSPDGKLVEVVELKGHPWFLGCQYHPEFQSKPMAPHPLFREFISASLKAKQA